VEELGDSEVRDLIVNRRAEEDDPLVQQPRVDIERALAERRLFDHHRDQRARSFSFLETVAEARGLEHIFGLRGRCDLVLDLGVRLYLFESTRRADLVGKELPRLFVQPPLADREFRPAACCV
jgi:hypothetical protein